MVFLPAVFIPEIADMDKDGDNDLLMSGFVRYYGEDGEETDVATMMYAKNTGSPTTPISGLVSKHQRHCIVLV